MGELLYCLFGLCTIVIATITKGNVFLPFCLLSHSGTVSSLAQTAKRLNCADFMLLHMPNTLHTCKKLLREKAELANPPHMFFSFKAAEDLLQQSETFLMSDA